MTKEEDLATLATDPPTYTALLQLEEKIKKLRLKGLAGISRANVQGPSRETGEYYISTIGSNLPVVSEFAGVTHLGHTPTTLTKSTSSWASKPLDKQSSTRCQIL